MPVGQREKSQKYFDLSNFNQNLDDSNPCSSLGVTNFQQWEQFAGSPGIYTKVARLQQARPRNRVMKFHKKSPYVLLRRSQQDLLHRMI